MQLTITRKTDYTGTVWIIKENTFEQYYRGNEVPVTATFIEMVIQKVLGVSVVLSQSNGGTTVEVSGNRLPISTPPKLDTAEKLRDYIILLVNTIRAVETIAESTTFEI